MIVRRAKFPEPRVARKSEKCGTKVTRAAILSSTYKPCTGQGKIQMREYKTQNKRWPVITIGRPLGYWYIGCRWLQSRVLGHGPKSLSNAKVPQDIFRCRSRNVNTRLLKSKMIWTDLHQVLDWDEARLVWLIGDEQHCKTHERRREYIDDTKETSISSELLCRPA